MNEKTKIKTEDEPRILELLQASVDAQIECWDKQHEIESLIGRDLDGLGDLTQHFAVGGVADLESFYMTFETELLRGGD